MDITITINTENNAFEDGADLETARLLRELADRIQRRGLPEDHRSKILDANGNTVGHFITESTS